MLDLYPKNVIYTACAEFEREDILYEIMKNDTAIDIAEISIYCKRFKNLLSLLCERMKVSTHYDFRVVYRNLISTMNSSNITTSELWYIHTGIGYIKQNFNLDGVFSKNDRRLICLIDSTNAKRQRRANSTLKYYLDILLSSPHTSIGKKRLTQTYRALFE